MKIHIDTTLMGILAICATAYLFILSLAAGFFFLIKEVVYPYFSNDTAVKALFFIGVIFLMIIVFLTLTIVKSRTASLIFIVFSALTGIVLIILSFLSLFQIYVGLAKIIFSWSSCLGGIFLLLFSFIIFFTNAPRLLQSSTKVKPGSI